MSNSEKHFYEFGPFRFDPDEQQLWCDGETVPLTHKACEVLLLLIRNGGHMVERDEFIRAIWPDTFVEESVLTVNISHLRKALEEQNGQKYIETVPRRGYRFVASVREIQIESPASVESVEQALITEEEANVRAEAELPSGRDTAAITSTSTQTKAVEIASEPVVRADTVVAAHPQPERARLSVGTKSFRRVASFVLAALVVAIIGILFGLDKFRRQPAASFGEMKITRLANTDRASDVVISPDGKYMVYVVSDTGRRSVWTRQVATNSSVQIVAPTEVWYGNLTFSRDSQYFYYVQRGNNQPENSLYQMPILGGTAKKIIDAVHSPITLSPDGERFAFVRNYPAEKESALMLANVDGTGEQKLAARKRPSFFFFPAWSPDGKVIACSAGNTDGSRPYSTVVEVQVSGGAERPIASQRWIDVEQVAWLSDGSGLIMTAIDEGQGPAQIWHLSYPSGEARRITNDVNNYGGISITADSQNLVSVQFELHTNLWMVPDGEISQAKQITTDRHEVYRFLAWTPDGKILYPSSVSGHRDIWIMEADGTGQKQLTENAHENIHPAASPDGRYIVLSSNRHGKFNIWRINIDGSDPKQLTGSTGELQPRCSPDGRWVVYTSDPSFSGQRSLWKVSIDGGAPVQVTEKISDWPVVSPDGKLIACRYKPAPDAPWKIALIPFAGGEPVKVFDVTPNSHVHWTPDGRAVAYIVTRDGVSNIWSQPVDGEKPIQLTDFKAEQIFGADWSPDGNLILSRGLMTRDIVSISDFR